MWYALMRERVRRRAVVRSGGENRILEIVDLLLDHFEGGEENCVYEGRSGHGYAKACVVYK